MKSSQLPYAGQENEELRTHLACAVSRCQVAASRGAAVDTAVLLKAQLNAAIDALDIVID